MSVITTPYSKTTPFLARVKARVLLNKAGSTKKTYLITLDLGDSGITYLPGDSIAIIPQNPQELVEQILTHVSLKDPTILHRKNLSRVTTKFLEKARIKADDPKRHIAQTDLLDNVKLASDIPEEAFEALPPLLPRFYSIASSQKRAGKTVDLLVASFTYMHNGSKRVGVGPHFLLNSDTIPLYVQPSHFRPTNGPMIMIGPGTGVAPFKAFIEDTDSPHWLFFGERCQKTDFYFEEFFASRKTLRLSTAFSRDQDEKCYVQHRMLEEGADLWKWYENGATIYICGDKRSMSKNVTEALVTIAEQHGHIDGASFIKTLRKEKRLLLDVY